MYSFIPSWYGDRGDWQGSILPWHETGHSYEFDDTVNHLRMFRDAGEETEILCLGWSPRLRRFLHRQSLDRISCWSVFDELQGITLQKPAVFSYLELPWPGGGRRMAGAAAPQDPPGVLGKIGRI